VASYGPHPGEEALLSGWRGSGTIFFSGCSLRCQYCQNAGISTLPGSGAELESEVLADMMLALQRVGCHNINLVTPSHVVPQILAAVRIAAQAGLHLPLVYNTSGWDALPTLALLDGVVDIYMPDMKYSSPQAGLHYSKVRDYPRINHEAVRAMHRQVGDLQVDDQGLAWRGLLVRHLVLPHGLAGTAEVVRFLAEEISPHTTLNLMDQYRPAHLARQYPQVARPITAAEYAQALQTAREAGLNIL
jgi:putative pyruvate formate lyase activating enzyme